MMKRVVLCVMVGGMLGFLVARVVPLTTEKVGMKRDVQGYAKLESIKDVCDVYPKTVHEITQRSQDAQLKAHMFIDSIVCCPSEMQTKDTMLRAYDQAYAYVGVERCILELVKMVYPSQECRQEAEKQFVALENFWTERVESNQALYKAFKTYEQGAAQKEDLKPYEKYLLENIMDSFKRAGLGLSDADRARVLELRKRCTQLESEYNRFLEEDTSTIKVSKDALVGVDEDFIAALPRDGDLYVLAMNYPIATAVGSYCTVEATRKAYSKAFKNRAYPANVPVLEELVAKRDEFAKLLGFESYAQYNLADQMIQTPERAWEFENSLLPHALKKAQQEFEELIQHLPEGVTLRADGKLEPWNFGYAATYFKKQKYSIDEREFAEYFPLEQTISGLMSVYEKFFNLSIKKILGITAWHDDVQLLEISSKEDGAVRGYVFLDMFPREKKYGHAAQFDGVRALKRPDGSYYPCVVTVVCNFTKPVGDKPSLLKYDEVNTFFHEFGHAIHSVLGAANYAVQAGTNTEVDFVELPSQMLENWIEDPEILKMISGHYKTGEPLSDALIQQRLELLKYGQGMFVASQLALGMICLSYFGPEKDKDFSELYKKYNELCSFYVPYYTDEHKYCSFGHLMGYGARYYGYMWSLVLAEDVFATIKEQGLLNPEAGKKYVDAIIGNGGSKDANEMVRDFLGREPSYDAFYKKMDF